MKTIIADELLKKIEFKFNNGTSLRKLEDEFGIDIQNCIKMEKLFIFIIAVTNNVIKYLDIYIVMQQFIYKENTKDLLPF